MTITLKQAQDARESLCDVFTPNGDAGCITGVSSSLHVARVKVDATTTRDASHHWYPLRELETAETLRQREALITANERDEK